MYLSKPLICGAVDPTGLILGAPNNLAIKCWCAYLKRLSSMSRVYMRLPAGSKSGVMSPCCSHRRSVFRDLPIEADASVMVKYCCLADMHSTSLVDGHTIGLHDLLSLLSVDFTDTTTNKRNINERPHTETAKCEQEP